MSRELKFGVIGTGYMGKAYAVALKVIPTLYPLSANPVCDMLASTCATGAQEKARAFGFERSTGDWRQLVDDPDIDVVGICSPTYLHKEMALAALAAGKHVICEKPLSLSSVDAFVMANAADQAGVQTLAGYNYCKNPATQLAKQLIQSGELGDIVHFRGTHNEDYLNDPSLPIDWRLKTDSAGRAGALGDLASHIINLAHYLCGPIAEVVGDCQVIYPMRPTEEGKLKAVENDDQTDFLLKFDSGVLGSISASRVATGRKMGLTYEIIGTKGSVCFDQERLAELKFYSTNDPLQTRGYRTLLMGPEHPEYAYFCAGAGHGFGYNDMIMIEMKDMIEAIVANKPLWPSFRDAAHTASVVDAVLKSQMRRCWEKISDVELGGIA